MTRLLVTALVCAAAIFAGDALFRTSLLHQVRPIILSPTDQAVMNPPVRLAWDGPRRMRVLLSIVGEGQRDLGVHESPLEIGRDHFPREGGYRVDLQAVKFGDWIRATRWFQVHSPQVAAPPSDHKAPAWDAKELLQALDAARTARDRAHGRSKFLSEENAALRDESQRLAKQLEGLYKTQEEDAEHAADLEKRLMQLSEENRALGEENAAIRQRLGSVIPCTVWGYYSFPQPQTIPPTRRVLLVSDSRGQIFRGQAECELIRRSDVTAASICFCVGNSWGG